MARRRRATRVRSPVCIAEDGHEMIISCPICGENITLLDKVTTNGRLIGSCGDAFTKEQWEAA